MQHVAKIAQLRKPRGVARGDAQPTARRKARGERAKGLAREQHEAAGIRQRERVGRTGEHRGRQSRRDVGGGVVTSATGWGRRALGRAGQVTQQARLVLGRTAVAKPEAVGSECPDGDGRVKLAGALLPRGCRAS